MALRLGFILLELSILFALECNEEKTALVKYFEPKKLRNLVSYDDISLFNFDVPDDVCELLFSLKAYESSADMYGMFIDHFITSNEWISTLLRC